MLDKTSSVYERAHATASVAFAGGKSFDAVIGMLMAEGFNEEDALEIAVDAQEVQRTHSAKPSSRIAIIFGMIILLAGVVAGLGNITGRLSASLCLGFVLLNIGWLFIRGGRGTG